ncbi:hypothetical protein BASA81_000025 [Batrachochytrium salamandrivorans]|nr:hypothetical protein BASA81_000025 [Batrachochytrium salamandrivorans]
MSCFPASTPGLGNSPEQRALGWGIYLSCLLLSLACFGVFVYAKYKLKLARLRRRHTVLVVFVFVGCVFQLHLDTLELIIQSANYNCTVKLFLAVLIVPLFAGGIAGRVVTFYFRSRYEQLVMEDRSSLTTTATPAIGGEGRDKSARVMSDAVTVADDLDVEDTLISTRQALWALLLGGKELFMHRTSPSLDLAALRYLQSGRVTIIFFLGVFVLPALVFAIVLVLVNRSQGMVECAGCLRTLEVCLFVSLQAAAASFFVLGALFRSRNFPDVFGILPETILALGFSIVLLIGYILSVALSPTEDGIWDYVVVSDIGLVGVIFVQSVWQVYIGMRADAQHPLLRKPRNNTIGNLDSDLEHLRLDRVLQHPELSKLFEDHLAMEFAVESLYFLRDAQKWTVEFPQLSVSTRNSRAKKLVNLYIRPSGVLAINLPHSMSKPVVDLIDSKADVDMDLFTQSIREIQLLLERGAIPRFSHKLEGMKIQQQQQRQSMAIRF